jgi:DNA-binding CsgD family transcriptional regulator
VRKLKTPESIVLSRREAQVCRLIAKEGLEDKEVAQRLEISRHRVRNCLSIIFLKTGARSREQMIIWAYRNQLIKSPC